MLLFLLFCCIITKNTERQDIHMDEQVMNEVQEPKPRRRRKTKMEIIKESYLPYIFLMAAAVLIVIFIIGALVRA